jgi:hypothetical protein
VKTTTHYNYEEVQEVSLPDTILISINGGETKEPPLKEWAQVHYFRFDDIEPHDNREWPGVGISPRYKGNNPDRFGYDLFTPQDAKRLAAIIRENWDRSIHIHCAAGVSRSAAIAEVLHMMGWEYICPPDRPFGYKFSNPWVKKLLKAEFPRLFGVLGDGGSQ